MNPRIFNAADREAPDALAGVLQMAVSEIKSQPAPEDGADRARGRALALFQANGRSQVRLRRRRILALAAMAAALFVGLLVVDRTAKQGTPDWKSEPSVVSFDGITFGGGGGDIGADVLDGFISLDAKVSKGQGGQGSGGGRGSGVGTSTASGAALRDRGIPNSSMGLELSDLTLNGNSAGGIPRFQDKSRININTVSDPIYSGFIPPEVATTERLDGPLFLDQNRVAAGGVLIRQTTLLGDKSSKKNKESDSFFNGKAKKDGDESELSGGEKTPVSRTSDHDKADKGKDAKSGQPAKKTSVYRRQAGRPTFARVYVGDNNSLELVSLQVTVTIEGPRARTVVDHVFRNPHDRQLEGTFEYPLPTAASPSYYAMFVGQSRDVIPPRFTPKGDATPLPNGALSPTLDLGPSDMVRLVDQGQWGRLQEAHVVNQTKALETYEEIVRGRIDPALLEYAGGNTFRGRVFPIPAKGYNRLILAYEELLPLSGEQAIYRFPLPDCPLEDLTLELQANPREVQKPKLEPPDASKEQTESRLHYARTWKGQGPGGVATFSYTPAEKSVQAISGRQSDSQPLYVFARIRPELKMEAEKPFASRALFLLDTSLSEHPDRFGLNMKLLKAILENNPNLKEFNILAFNVASAWVEPKAWLANNAAGREKAWQRLDNLVLEGATDLGAALIALASPPSSDTDALAREAPTEVFVLSDGLITWGERDAGKAAARFESRLGFPARVHCYRTGMGADNLELFHALSRRGGGIFNCFTEADVKAASTAHRHSCLAVHSVRFAGGVETHDVLVAGRQASVYPGGDVIVAARAAKAGKNTLVLEGEFQGRKWAQEYPITLDAASDLAPRGWGELAVGSLLALNDSKLDDLATAYCQQFSIGSRVASFLILENEADYKRLNLEDERGKTHAGDLGQFLESAWRQAANLVPPRAAFERLLDRVAARVNLRASPEGASVTRLMSRMKDAEFAYPETSLLGKLLHKNEVPAAYLAKRDADLRDVSPYLTEARRRAEVDDAAGAVQALSTIAEIYPGRSDSLRLVGYRLLDLHQPAQAVQLFGRILEHRPFEAQSYRDLARSLEEAGQYGLAALHYEMILAGTWHARFHESLKEVTREEYVHMMREAIAKKAVSPDLANQFGERLEKMDPAAMQADLRVTISWNTDNTDVDLWVIEPSGEKCFYQNRNTKSGGVLSQDQTQGYGPERYVAKNAQKGVYRLVAHYYSANRNLLGGETHVNVVITQYAGTDREKTIRKTVILRRQNEEVELGQVEF